MMMIFVKFDDSSSLVKKINEVAYCADPLFENSVATVEFCYLFLYQYQEVENQNSKHNIEACGTISSSNSILKIDSIFLMALLY